MREANIIKYYPNVTKNYREIEQIPRAENPELNLLWSKIGDVWLDQFIMTLNLGGIRRWEAMLRLRPRAADTLRQRRVAILVKINETLPYTHRRLEQILNALCGESGYALDINYDRYTLCVVTNPDTATGLNRISQTLYPIVPANLALYIVMRLCHLWPIRSAAAVSQFVEARHCVWNLGAARFTYWDGEFDLGAVIRLDGIYPNELYRERQLHEVEAEGYASSHQRGSPRHGAAPGQASDARQIGEIGHAARLAHAGEGRQVFTLGQKVMPRQEVDSAWTTDHRRINVLDGGFCFDGSHQLDGDAYTRAPHGHCCTMMRIKKGIEGVAETI